MPYTYPFIASTYDLPLYPYRPKSIVTEIYCSLIPSCRFKVTPVEFAGVVGAPPVFTIPPVPSTDKTASIDNTFPYDPVTNKVCAVTWDETTNTASIDFDHKKIKPVYASDSDAVRPNAYRSYNPHRNGRGSIRSDMKLVRASTNGTGWEFQFEIRGNAQRFDGLYPHRGIAVQLCEYLDYENERRYCIYNQQIARVFIKDEGGISIQQGPDGEDVCVITAVTPDYFLARDKIPKMPYLLRSVVERERAAWTTRSRTETALGFTPLGSGSFTADPFAGFATYTDQFTASANELLSVKPANEAHILTYNSVAHALEEIFAHHVFSNRGGGFQPIGGDFNIDIRTDQSPETQVVSVEVGPGSPHDMCMEAIRHGNWDYWWDNLSNMHFKLNPCSGNWSDMKTFSLVLGPGSIGTVRVAPPPVYPTVNRVAVEGQWSQTYEGGIAPLDNFTFNPGNKAVYPPGQPAGGEGSDVIFQGYLGVDTNFMAKSEFARQNEKATVTISGIPIVGFLFELFHNAVIWLQAVDPLGGYDFSNGKYFSVENVEIEVKAPDARGGGYPVGTLYLQEIRTS